MKKTLIKIILGILAIGLIYVAWLFLKSFWAPTLFWIYIVIAIIFFIVSAFGIWFVYGRKTSNIEQGIIQTGIPSNWFMKIRFLSATMLQIITGAIAWPAESLRFLIGHYKYRLLSEDARTLAFKARISLNPLEALVALTVTFMVILTYLADLILPSPAKFRCIFLALLAAHVMLRHLSYIVNTQPLPALLRKSSGSPYIRFVIIAFADILTLVLTFTGYFVWKNDGQLTMAQLWKMGIDIITFSELREALLSGAQISMFDFFKGLAGLMFCIAGLRSVFKFREFNRNSEDLNALAINHILIGQFKEAKNWLSKIKDPGAITQNLYAIMHMEMGNLERAEKTVRKATSLTKMGEESSDDEVFNTLIGFASLMPINPKMLLKIFKKWFSKNAADAVLSSSILLVIRQNRLSPADVENLFSEDDSSKRFPLSYSIFLFNTDKVSDAKQILESLNPSSVIDKIVRYFLIHACCLEAPTDEDMKSEIMKWHKESFPKLKQYLSDLVNDLERIITLEYLYIVADYYEFMKLGDISEFHMLSNNIRQQISKNEKTDFAIRFLENDRIARRKTLKLI